MAVNLIMLEEKDALNDYIDELIAQNDELEKIIIKLKKDNKSLTSIDEGLLKIKFECSNYNIDNLSFFISLLNHFNIINIDEAKYLVDIVTNSDRESHEEDPDFSKLLDTATSCLKDLDLNAFIHGTYENILHEDSIENAYLYARALFNYDAMVDYRKNN